MTPDSSLLRPVVVRLTAAQIAWLDEQARTRGISRSEAMRTLIDIVRGRFDSIEGNGDRERLP